MVGSRPWSQKKWLAAELALVKPDGWRLVKSSLNISVLIDHLLLAKLTI